jgi:hypothetical protein
LLELARIWSSMTIVRIPFSIFSVMTDTSGLRDQVTCKERPTKVIGHYILRFDDSAKNGMNGWSIGPQPKG